MTLSLLETVFLLDESLDQAVAEALRLVGYGFTTVFRVFPGRTRVPDPEIIEWLHQNDSVWVHADDKAKKEHGKLVIAKNIRTLWVYRPRGMMTGAEQLRILSYVLPILLDNYRQNPSRKHYAADVLGQPPRTKIRLRQYQVRG